MDAGPLPDLTSYRRKLSRSSLILAAFIAVVSVATSALLSSRSAGDPLPENAPPEAVPVLVAKVIDGDTLDVRSAETTIRVRLYGVDTPERSEACYAEATQRLTALAGERVLLIPDRRQADQYGRELRYVYTNSAESIDEALIREGLARAWREDASRRDALVALEEQARAAKTGCLWSGD